MRSESGFRAALVSAMMPSVLRTSVSECRHAEFTEPAATAPINVLSIGRVSPHPTPGQPAVIEAALFSIFSAASSVARKHPHSHVVVLTLDDWKVGTRGWTGPVRLHCWGFHAVAHATTPIML